MNTTDNQRLQEITARCDAATPGPWKVVDKGNSVRSFAVVSESYIGVPQQMICPNMSPKTANADFIAHSREDVPFLLSVIAEQQQTIAAAMEDIKHPSVCERCSRDCQGDIVCIDNGYMDFDWRGVPKEARTDG